MFGWLGWLLLGIVVGAIAMFAYDHKNVIENRSRLESAGNLIDDFKGVLGVA